MACWKSVCLKAFSIKSILNKGKIIFYSKFKKNKKNFILPRVLTIEEAFLNYKINKELYIKQIADKWKGIISDKTYYAMYNYKVEITD